MSAELTALALLVTTPLVAFFTRRHAATLWWSVLLPLAVCSGFVATSVLYEPCSAGIPEHGRWAEFAARERGFLGTVLVMIVCAIAVAPRFADPRRPLESGTRGAALVDPVPLRHLAWLVPMAIEIVCFAWRLAWRVAHRCIYAP